MSLSFIKVKKACILAFPLITLCCLILLCFSNRNNLTFPIPIDQIESISLYYNGQKKEVTSTSDISYVVHSVTHAYSHGSYEKIPTGGQTFFISFHLTTGTSFLCTYYQTTDSSGYYADKESNLRVSSLNFAEIWDNLSAQAFTETKSDFFVWPSL